MKPHVKANGVVVIRPTAGPDDPVVPFEVLVNGALVARIDLARDDALAFRVGHDGRTLRSPMGVSSGHAFSRWEVPYDGYPIYTITAPPEGEKPGLVDPDWVRRMLGEEEFRRVRGLA